MREFSTKLHDFRVLKFTLSEINRVSMLTRSVA